MASSYLEDELDHPTYFSNRFPYTIHYTRSTSSLISDRADSGELAKPSVVSNRDDDITEAPHDPNSDLVPAAGTWASVPDNFKPHSARQSHQGRATDYTITPADSVQFINTLGIIDPAFARTQHRLRDALSTTRSGAKKSPNHHRKNNNITDEEIRCRIESLERVVAQARSSQMVTLVEKLEECIHEWQSILDIREKKRDARRYADFVEVPEMAQSMLKGSSCSSFAYQTDEEKSPWARFCAHQVRKALSLEAVLPSVIRGSSWVLFQKTRITHKAGHRPEDITHDGNADFDASTAYDIINYKEAEEPWELL